jgi:HNH endonuclease
MEMIELECVCCHKKFMKQAKKYRYGLNKGTKKFYCSIECHNSDNRGGEWKTCTNCGKEVWKTRRVLDRSVSGNVFCGRSCSQAYNNRARVGEKHPNFNGGIGSYRQRALEVSDQACVSCGWSEDARVLQVHHIDENRRNNDLSNLVVLCPTCHTKLTLGYYTLDVNHKVIPKE